MTDATPSESRISRWLASPFGQTLLLQESRLVESTLDGMFGEQFLQIGAWGQRGGFARFARTQRAATLIGMDSNADGDAVGHFHRLPVATGSVDVVLLPHTLDFVDDRSSAIIREADRVLTPHGQLIVLGFKPGGLWGLRRLLPGAGIPPDSCDLLSDAKLTDWLQLLDMRIHGVTRYFFRWPLSGNRGLLSARWETIGRRFWPELAACYMLVAQKRVVTLTPVQKPWRARPQVVGGIAKPTTRVSRIRFERDR